MSRAYGDPLRSGNSNPYGNGYGSNTNPYEGYSNNTNPYADSAPTSEARGGRPVFKARERRQGGYGALTSPNGPQGFGGFLSSRDDLREEDVTHVNRPTSLERSQAKRRSGGIPFAQRSPTRRQYGDGSRQIEEVLGHIRRDWDFMTEEKCIPVQVALQLMDNSSLGLASRYNQFRDIHQQLQNALRAIVNEHHQGFNSSIGTFHSIQAAIQTSQTKLKTLKESLLDAKSSLSTTKPELKGLATSSQSYDDMLQVLTSIEHLQGIPEKLEARISEKRFLSAVELLQDALKTMQNPNMNNIGALSDLRVYLSNQEHSLTDILIEELHNHLYLKSPYCETRWKQYTIQHAKSKLGNGDRSAVDVRGRQLFQYLDKLDTGTSVMQDDSSRNPEADSFVYIQLLVESLNSLGRLDVAVDTITHRLPVELFKVVEKSSNEADQRHPASLRGAKTGEDLLDFTNAARTAVLEDHLGTLYARFEAIAEGHRVVHEVISGILKREGLRTSSALTGGFRELWKLFQSEIRSLLHDYLAADGNLSYKSGGGGDRAGSVFQRTQRDKTKNMFKLTDMDSKSSDLTNEREDLDFILKSSVPGLVSDSKRPEATNQITNGSGVDSSATGHKLLVEPSVFNMTALLPPSLTFLNRLKEVVPPTSDIALSTLTSFLDDFLVNVFLPQLDETLMELSLRSFIDADSFQQDPLWATQSKRPIFKGAHRFFDLITAFCKMLDILPHDQAFSQLIITQMVTYYDKCCGWYKALVSRAQPHPQSGKRMKMAAVLTEDGETRDAVISLLQAGEADVQGLLEKESALLIKSSDEFKIDEADIISDRRNISALCLLYTSMKWLAGKIVHLRHISNQAIDSSRRDSGKNQNVRRWTIITTAEKQLEAGRVYLPLNPESAVAFDGVVTSYQQLAANVLRMLHVEIRCHIIYHISRSMSRTFLLDQELNDPDPEILALNADIVDFDEEASTHLMHQQQSFIITGLSNLLDTLLIHSAAKIPTMNAHGCGRLQLNILVLQQNLKNVEARAQLTRSAVYFDMFSAGPEAIVQAAKEQGRELGFSVEEMKILMELVYSEGLGSERRDVVVQAKRGLDEDVLALSEYLW